MQALSGPQLTHLGFLVRDLEAMISFYTSVLGLVVTDRGPYSRVPGAEIVFLSGNPEEHHQIVFVTGRTENHDPSIVNQISFRVGSLEDLRGYHARLLARKMPGIEPRNHGNAWSVYFPDPDGNRIELYVPSPWYVAQPFGKPFDLTEPVAAIMEKTEAMVRDHATFAPREQWAGKLAERLRPS